MCRTSWQVFVVPLGKTLAGFSHLGVVSRWPASPKEVGYSDHSAYRDRRINMHLNSKITLFIMPFEFDSSDELVLTGLTFLNW